MSNRPSGRRDGLIITADDFGLAAEVNAAVERAHRDGVLTAASLMVGAPAAAEAIAIAQQTPSLRVGLHLVLTEGIALLPPGKLPALVDDQGRFRGSMAGVGFRVLLDRSARRQLAAEIEAQFTAFHASGLPLDHVNAHKHFHVHPSIGGLVLEIGRRYGMRALRVPREPAAIARTGPAGARIEQAVMAPFVSGLARKARRQGILIPDAVVGLAWSGHWTTGRLRETLSALPPGLVEIYLHPATADRFPGSAPGYAYRQELAALLAPEVLAGVHAGGRRTGGFAEFAS